METALQRSALLEDSLKQIILSASFVRVWSLNQLDCVDWHVSWKPLVPSPAHCSWLVAYSQTIDGM